MGINGTIEKVYTVGKKYKKNNMKLKQFIKDALLSVTNGVDDANKENNRFKIIGIKHESGIDGNYADFDVSVVVNEESSGEAGGENKLSWLDVFSGGRRACTHPGRS